MIRKNPKLKCMCMREAASSYDGRAAGLGENQTKLRLHSFPVSGLLLLLFFNFFSWTFLSFGREWASDSMTSRFLISRFSLIKDNYFYHLCQNSNGAPTMIISILLPHVYTPLFDLAQHGRYYLHSTWKLEILIIAPWYSISFEIRTLNHHDFYLST